MREDLGEYLATARTSQPKLEDIWFGAAYRELEARGAIPHLADESDPILHGSQIALRCEHCWEN